MSTPRRFILAGVLLSGCIVLFRTVPAYFKARNARIEAEWQHRLRDAIQTGDAERVETLAKKRVNIYTTDTTGESLLTLAEKSGNARILEALAPYRDRAIDLRRAQNAVETGTSMGLQPVPSEREFNVAAAMKEETEKYQALWSQPPPPAKLADSVQEKIDALPEGERKEWALRNFALHIARDLPTRAQETALRLKDPTRRVDVLIAIGQRLKGDAITETFRVIRREIDYIPEASVKDPLYAQLAWLQNLRGYPGSARETCYAIQSPDFKNGTCAAK